MGGLWTDFGTGIAYQLVPDDPLVDNTQCGLDSALMAKIGTNSIRVYHVDPSLDHDDCMKTFADAGIYIWLDLDTFDTQIGQDKPQWNQTQLDRFSAVMDTFHKYDNLGGFFVGNEVLTTGMPSQCPTKHVLIMYRQWLRRRTLCQGRRPRPQSLP